ncbi:TonB-dependent receptor [Novosphingobium sp. KCTC 2891]|uniref:TonB-dependent receptor domain-containing protein n=1 Tax=Novosphingobium sp. KCTC 2891 TaxID=2989730 RepID=UPI002223BE7C|nr:TonB-dependent receptor [Novosphingobium sp. KCTC 2891]MCW1381199.1 TonB-dependent receptor [Novosphingobium sp. KCTC 2891]
MTRSLSSLAAATLLTPFAPAFAAEGQDAPTATAPVSIGGDNLPVDSNGDGVDDAGEILVVATRLKGQVSSVQPPLVTLDEEEIASYGAGSIQELLSALAPQTGSGRGRGDGAPVVLLNGMRISGFREMRGLPPEAIRRVEVLPEEVALKYGYRPDQRVVNFILKDNFRSFGSETDLNLPGGGGYSDWKQELTLARIDNGARFNVTGTFEDQSPLTEGERGIVQAGGAGTAVTGDPVPADYRTLLADTRSAALNATLAKPLGGGAGLTVNALLQRDDSRSLNGLNSVVLTDPDGTAYARSVLTPEPLATRKRTTTISAGAALNKPLGGWQLALTADGSHVVTESTIDNRADLSGLQALVDAGTISASGALPGSAIAAVGPDRARSRTNSFTSLATLTGQPLRLPGGEASLTVKAGYAYSGIRSSDTRTLSGETSLTRGDAQAGFSLDLPITSRRENFGAGVGDLSLNLNGEVHHLSDFGSLTDYGAGLTWALTEKLSLSASYIATQAAPGLSDLGAPTTVTTGVALYDFTRGESVLATVISGGNPNLQKEQQRDIKLAANWDLPFLKNSSLIVEYFRNRSTNTTNAFPLLTPEVEAAFPGRVVRDAAGRIVSVDQSPVTFAEETSSRLRFGINLSGSFGKPDPNARRGGMRGMMAGGPPPGGAGAGGPPLGGGFGRGMRGGGPGGGGDGRGRWNLSLTHTIQFMNRVQIVPGGAVLDLLDGDAVSGGGVARHSFQLEGGGFYRGFGLRVNGTYTGGTHVDASGAPGSTRLDFAPIAKVNLRVFADLGRQPKLVEKVPFFKGARLSLGVDNLFDAQQRVTDANGDVPLRYQPGYLDPAGRVFKLEFRKQF